MTNHPSSLFLNGLVGRFAAKNRFQVWLAAGIFSVCAWGVADPKAFHALDVVSFTTLFFLYFQSGFWVDLGFNILRTALPLLVMGLLNGWGATFWSRLMWFWVAYAFQGWYRFFDGYIYRTPATIFLVFSLGMLFYGLYASLQEAEDEFLYESESSSPVTDDALNVREPTPLQEDGQDD